MAWRNASLLMALLKAWLALTSLPKVSALHELLQLRVLQDHVLVADRLGRVALGRAHRPPSRPLPTFGRPSIAK